MGLNAWKASAMSFSVVLAMTDLKLMLNLCALRN